MPASSSGCWPGPRQVGGPADRVHVRSAPGAAVASGGGAASFDVDQPQGRVAGPLGSRRRTGLSDRRNPVGPGAGGVLCRDHSPPARCPVARRRAEFSLRPRSAPAQSICSASSRRRPGSWSKSSSRSSLPAKSSPVRASRRLVADGQVGEARQLLTEPYRVRGMVVHGAGPGRKDRLCHGQRRRDRYDSACPRRLCGPGAGGRPIMAGRDQRRCQSDLRRADGQGRGPSRRLARPALRLCDRTRLSRASARRRAVCRRRRAARSTGSRRGRTTEQIVARQPGTSPGSLRPAGDRARCLGPIFATPVTIGPLCICGAGRGASRLGRGRPMV